MAKMATAAPSRKTVAGAGGGLGFGAALTTLVLYGLEQLSGEPLPTVVSASVAIVITAALGAITAYFVKPSPADQIVADSATPLPPPLVDDGSGARTR